MMSKKILFAILAFFCFVSVEASHLMGGEITWECMQSGPTQGMYIFQLKVYRDCNGISITPTTQTLIVHNHPSIFNINLTILPNSPTDISPSCDPINSGNPQLSCLGGGQGAVEEYVYVSLPIVLPGVPPAGGWHFTWDDCCRNGAISNGFANEGFTLRAVMYQYNGPGGPQNTTPCFDSIIGRPTWNC